MPDEQFDPSKQSMVQAIMQGNPADAIINADNLRQWIIRLQIFDYQEATEFALAILEAQESKKYGQEEAEGILLIAQARSAYKGSQIKLFAGTIGGQIAMALRGKDNNNGDTRDKR